MSLLETCKQWSGSIQIGVSTIPISDSFQPTNLPPVVSGISYETWYLSGSDIKRNHITLKTNYCPNLEWLTPGHKVRTTKKLLSYDFEIRWLFTQKNMKFQEYKLVRQLDVQEKLFKICF